MIGELDESGVDEAYYVRRVDNGRLFHVRVKVKRADIKRA
jgi:hypothetical protein